MGMADGEMENDPFAPHRPSLAASHARLAASAVADALIDNRVASDAANIARVDPC
jgi:hypothetical protein